MKITLCLYVLTVLFWLILKLLIWTPTPDQKVKMCEHFARSILFIFCVPYLCTCPVSCKKGRNWCISGWKMFVFLFCSCLMLTHKTMYVYICLMFLALNLGDIQIITQGKILYNLLMECTKKLLDGVVFLPRVVLCQEEGRQQVFLK